jgi:hypothetical protein
MAVYVCSVVLLDNIESWMFLSIEEEFEDTKGLIRIRKTKERQHNYQKKKKRQKGKQRSTKHTQKIKDRSTRTPLKTGDEFTCCGRVFSSCSTSCTRLVIIEDISDGHYHSI